jgi:RNA polymerase sigma-70 factor (ECF subfamily)
MLRMHRGDERAAEMLWAHFSTRLVAYARVVLPSGQGFAAEDVVQGVFLKVIGMRRRSVRDVVDGTAVLYRMTRNEAINAGRSELREQARRRSAVAQGSSHTVDEEMERVLGAIEGLVYEQREVLLLRYIGGLTVDQVAETLGVARGTVASRSRLGMEKVRAVLGAEKDVEVRDG